MLNPPIPLKIKTDKGPDFQNINENQRPGFVYDLIHGQNPYYPNQSLKPDWYQLYCAEKPEKACMLSEAGAAWHDLPNLVASARNTQVCLLLPHAHLYLIWLIL